MRRLKFQDSFGESVEGYDANRSTLKVYEQRVEGAAPGQRSDIAQIRHAGTAMSHRRPARARLKLAHNIPLGIPLRQQSGQETGQGLADRAGPHRAALRIRKLERHLSRHGRVSGRSHRGRAADRVEPRRCRLPLVHIVAPGFTAYVDDATMAQMRGRGKDRCRTLRNRCKAEAAVSAIIPASPSASMYAAGTSAACRTAKAYDALAERLFNELPHDRFCSDMTRRAPAAFAPPLWCRRAGWSCSDSSAPKWPSSKSMDTLKQRIDEGGKFCPSTSSPSRRNAALPPTWSGILLQAPMIRGASWKSLWKRRGRFGDSPYLSSSAQADNPVIAVAGR